MMARVIQALMLSLLGGFVGGFVGILIASTDRQWSVAHSVDWGALLGGMAAGLAAIFVAQRAVAEYVLRQERDEVSRRFVDEGIDHLGRRLAEAYATQVGNLMAINLATSMAKAGDIEGTEATLRTLVPGSPVANFEAARLSAQLDDEVVRRLFDIVVADLDRAFRHSSQALPSMIRAAISKSNTRDRDEVVMRIRVLVSLLGMQLAATRRHVIEGLAELSIAFQSARVSEMSKALRWKTVDGLESHICQFVERARKAIDDRAACEDTLQLRGVIREKLAVEPEQEQK